MTDRPALLHLSPFPPSPPTFGAQRRMEGLMVALARRYRLTGVSLAPPGFDLAACEAAMRRYCDEVALVPVPASSGASKRARQLLSMISPRSYERQLAAVPALQRTVDRLLRARPFEVVSIAFPFLAHLDVRQAPPGARPPRVVVDQHNIEHDLARQSASASDGLVRRAYHGVNWRKLCREERAAWTAADGVTFTSRDDLRRAERLVPGLRGEVIPNAVDVAYFRPDPALPAPDGRTVVFFGALNYFPNQDGLRFFFQEIWPRLSRLDERVRVKIIGPQPTPEIRGYGGPRVDVLGLVDDLRPHLASAAAVIVPLRVGGGTRFKIVEAMAMARPVVSTRLGAEGLAVTPEQDVLLADEPEAFARAVCRLLDDPALGARLGGAARALAERSYSWTAVGDELARFAGALG